MIARASHKRYAHAMDWQLYHEDTPIFGEVQTNEKVFANAISQVLDAMSMCNATHAALVWTARGGEIHGSN